MKKLKLNKNQMPALISLFIVFVCYVAEKAFKRLTPWGSTSAVIQAIVFTVAVAAVLLLLYKSNDIYFGMLAAIFAFKLLPPDIVMLRSVNIDAASVYYLVRKAALVLFLVLIYRFYEMQTTSDKYEKIHAVAIGLLLLAIPFCTEIGAEFARFAKIKTGSMMVPYACQAASYIIAAAVLAAVCFVFKGKSAAIIIDFSVIGFLINIARKATSALIIANAGYHVSKSYICWIAIYAVLAVAFVLIRKKTVTVK